MRITRKLELNLFALLGSTRVRLSVCPFLYLERGHQIVFSAFSIVPRVISFLMIFRHDTVEKPSVLQLPRLK